MKMPVERLNSMSNRQLRILQIILLLLAGIISYSNSLHVPFVMDDGHISTIGQKGILETLLHGGSRCVVDATFGLNYLCHGVEVTGYHVVNLVIHLSTSVVLYVAIFSAGRALRSSFPQVGAGVGRSASIDYFVPLAAALFFVTHPLQTQAVTYTIQRYTSLATLLYLLAVLFFIKSRLAYERNGICFTSVLLGCGSLVATLLAICSKQISFTLPIMLLLLELFLFRGTLLTRRFYAVCGAAMLFLLILGLLRWQGSSFNDVLFDIHNATSEDTQISRATYFLTQTRVVVTYLRLLLLPYGQSLIHETPVYTTLLSMPVIASLSLHLSLFIASVVLFKRSRLNLASDSWEVGALQRLASLGIVWFYTAMIVESSIFPILDMIFEHRVYLPSVGFFITLAAGIALLARGEFVGVTSSWLIVAVVCGLLGGLTVVRNHAWNDRLVLWQNAVAKAPHNVLALTNLADEYQERNMPDKALRLFVKAIELKPNLDAPSKVYLGEALQKLQIPGFRFTTGKEYVLPDGGTLDFRFAGIVFNNMGLAYEYLGENDKALQAYRKAVQVIPEYAPAWFNLGLLSERAGNREQVAMAMNVLHKLNPLLADMLSSATQR